MTWCNRLFQEVESNVSYRSAINAKFECYIDFVSKTPFNYDTKYFIFDIPLLNGSPSFHRSAFP